VTKEKLEEYCKDKGIFVPKGATREYLCAAIVRAYGHEQKNGVVSLFNKSCFGAWEQDDSTCRVCDFREKCFTASMGMTESDYFKKLESAENPRLRFQSPTRTKKKK
jgi:hypothetical protein